MSIATIISEIDAEISLLEQARALLAGLTSTAAPKKRGRPAKAAGAAMAVKADAKPTKKKRTISPEARARMAAAAKARWAAVKKAAKK